MAVPLLLGGAALAGASMIPGRTHFVPIADDDDQTARPELEPTNPTRLEVASRGRSA